jgi:hypothetical protein
VINLTESFQNWILRGDLQQFDTAKRVLSKCATQRGSQRLNTNSAIGWDLLWIDAHNPSHALDTFGGRDATRLAIGIYRGQELIPEKNATLRRDQNHNNTDDPMPGNKNITKRLENPEAVPVAIVGRHPYDNFATDITMGQYLHGYESFCSLADYPFDKARSAKIFSDFH